MEDLSILVKNLRASKKCRIIALHYESMKAIICNKQGGAINEYNYL